MKKVNINNRRLRSIVQFLSFVIHNLGFNMALKTGIITPALYCYGCPLAFFACPFGTLQHFIALSRFSPYLAGSIGAYSMFAGRFYCGWICPFGAFQDLVRGVGKRIGIKGFKVRYLMLPPLIVLALALLLAYIYEDTVFCRACPSGTLFATIPYHLLNPGENPSVYFYLHVLSLATVVILTLSIDRFWCRYLCPIGIIYGLFNKLSLIKVKVDENLCSRCGICLKSCPMGISSIKDIGSSPGCILCLECMRKCPTKAIKLRL